MRVVVALGGNALLRRGEQVREQVHLQHLAEAVETLAALQDAGLEVAVVTNLTTRIQMKKIEALGIGDHVDLVLTSEETGREKPSSVMFTLPMAQLDVKPSETVMVGDSVSSDIEGGNALGLTTVLFNNDATGLDHREQPDHRIESFREVTEVVL